MIRMMEDFYWGQTKPIRTLEVSKEGAVRGYEKVFKVKDDIK